MNQNSSTGKIKFILIFLLFLNFSIFSTNASSSPSLSQLDNNINSNNNDRISLNFKFTLIDNINSTNLSNKTIFSEDGNKIYFVNSKFIIYSDLNSILSITSPTGTTSISTNVFKYSNDNLLVLNSIGSNNDFNKLFSMNRNYYYQIDLSKGLINKTICSLSTRYQTNHYSTNYNDNFIITMIDVDYPEYDFFFIDYQQTVYQTTYKFKTLPTMLISDSKNQISFFSCIGSIFLFNLELYNYNFVQNITDGGIRYSGSIDSANKLVYFCSQIKGYSNLSIEVYSYSLNGMNRIKIINVTVEGGMPLTKCQTPTTNDFIQGQLFFLVQDNLLNQFILSMDINGDNQQILNLNWQFTNTSYITSILAKRSITNSLNDNKLIIASNTGSPLFIYNYKSICLNDCSGNGNCLNLICHCENGYGLNDCSQKYPILSTISSLPLKRPGIITLTGNYFGDGISLTTKISIGGIDCLNVQFKNNDQLLECYFNGNLTTPSSSSSSSSNNYTVTITVGNLSISSTSLNNNYFKYLLPSYSNEGVIQINDEIIISGNNIMQLEDQSTFKLGTSNINKAQCIGNLTNIICKLPSDSINGQLVLIDIYGFTVTYQVYLKPQIISISPNLISTSSTKIIITGYFFTYLNQPIGGTGSTIEILNGLKLIQLAIIKSSTILELITPSYIIDNPSISISINNYYTSPSISYNYLPPIITGFIQPIDNNGLLRILGSNFIDPIDKTHLLSITYSTSSGSTSSSSSGSLLSSIMELNLNYIDIKLSNDFISSNIIINIDNRLSNQTSGLTFLNLKPIINEINPFVPTSTGGIVTIKGSYLGSGFYYSQISGGNEILLNCNKVSLNGGSLVSCIIPSGSGTFKIISESYNVKSDVFITNYAYPIIDKVIPNGFFTANSPKGFEIEILGSNFINDKLLVQSNLLIGSSGSSSGGESSSSLPCIISTLNSTYIKCTFTSNQNSWPTSIPINITVNQLSSSSDNDKFYHYTHCPGTPFECSNNGVCNYITGLCNCNYGFQIKSDCSISTTIISTTTSTSTSSSSSSSSQTTTTTNNSGSGNGGSTTTTTNNNGITTSTSSNPSSTSSTSNGSGGSGNSNTATSTSKPTTSSTTALTTTNNGNNDSVELVSSSNYIIINSYHNIIIIIIIMVSIFILIV